ncbi:MAG: hypothetical protein P8H59_11630 [Flavobacteriales bacterium]|nr:hypothetical protein [Flavobacteriales bacterium]MDG1781596.1 hypothetical protein [Flavobacteriales bacterium]MDG2247341.1 hypothetical protein [Flavobacteriales bacterium]
MRLTNNYEHAGDNRYMVYEFYLDEHADEFQAMLEEKNIVFQRFKDEDQEDPPTLFGIEKTYLKEATWCNNMIHSKYRKPMIPNAIMRWGLLIITAVLISLAVIGYLKTK